METYHFLNELEISYLHVFTYSERPGTSAIEMEGIVPVPERKSRNKMLRILSEKKQHAFYRMNEGSTAQVLWEHENLNGMMEGYSENYIRVKAEYDAERINNVTEVMLENFEDGMYTASVLRKQQPDVKKVLIITYYWPPNGSSGVQRWLKFAKYLKEFGWTPVIYTPEILS
jgi:threonylcarbamoyladenosine tRNA methylthiotransferase MtaB